jgi:GTP-binding protein
VIEAYPPPTTKGVCENCYCIQLPTQTPQFVFFANMPQYVKEPYKRYLENKIRENWTFQGTNRYLY